MPITQDRMLELLDAALDYRQAVTQIISIAKAENERVTNGTTTLQDSYEYLVTNMNPLLLLRAPNKSEITIILEAKHFKKFKEQNARKAEKLRENREAARLGIERPDRGPSSAPKSASDIPATVAKASRKQTTSDTNQARLDRANAIMDGEGPAAPSNVFDPSQTVSQEELDSLEAFGKQQDTVLAGLDLNKGDHK